MHVDVSTTKLGLRKLSSYVRCMECIVWGRLRSGASGVPRLERLMAMGTSEFLASIFFVRRAEGGLGM